MAVKIRLRQQGRSNRHTYRVVVADARFPRDGKYIEMLGWYSPCSEKNNLSVNAERLNYWLNQGAEVSPQVRAIALRAAPEVMKEHREKAQASRVKKAAKRRALRKK